MAAVNKTKRCPKITSGFGAFLVVFGVLVLLFAPGWLQSVINDQLVLSPQSKRFSAWKAPDIPIYTQFYMFDVENPEDVKNGEPPSVRQRGPYSYRVYQTKRNISWNGNDTASFNQFTKYIFDASTSCDSCDPQTDEINLPNVPLVILSQVSKMYPGSSLMFRLLFSMFKEDFFKTLSVHELLWGYKDPVFEAFAELRKRFKLNFIPQIDPVFALVENNTLDGWTTVYTGAEHIDRLLTWQQWKGKESVGLWKTHWANMLNGSDGTQFPPGTRTTDKLYAFFVQLCRSVYFEYDSPSSVRGIDTLRFTYPRQVWQNASTNPDNAGFCPHQSFPDGIMDISVCKTEVPVVLPVILNSQPHFYQGDQSLVEAVQGMSPNKEEHGTFLHIEPHFGLPLHVDIRFQLTINIEPIEAIPQTQGIKPVLLPLTYFNNSVTIDKATADLLKEALVPMAAIPWVSAGLICLGCLLMCVYPIQVLRQKRRRRWSGKVQRPQRQDDETKPLLNSRDQSKETIVERPAV